MKTLESSVNSNVIVNVDTFNSSKLPTILKYTSVMNLLIQINLTSSLSTY